MASPLSPCSPSFVRAKRGEGGAFRSGAPASPLGAESGRGGAGGEASHGAADGAGPITSSVQRADMELQPPVAIRR
jgi:hypothetical protein